MIKVYSRSPDPCFLIQILPVTVDDMEGNTYPDTEPFLLEPWELPSDSYFSLRCEIQLLEILRWIQ